MLGRAEPNATLQRVELQRWSGKVAPFNEGGQSGVGVMTSLTHLQEVPGGSSLVGFGAASDRLRQLAVRHRGNKVGLWSLSYLWLHLFLAW